MANNDTNRGRSDRRDRTRRGSGNGDGDGNNEGVDPRAMLVDLLLQKIAEDPYPSVTMMDLIEELLVPDDLPAYAAVLMDKIRGDAFPSVPMMKRLVDLTEPA